MKTFRFSPTEARRLEKALNIYIALKYCTGWDNIKEQEAYDVLYGKVRELIELGTFPV